MKIVKEQTRKVVACHVVEYPAESGKFHWHENMEICQLMDKPCRFLIDGEMIHAKKAM